MGEDIYGFAEPSEAELARQRWAADKIADLQIVGRALQQGLLTEQLKPVDESGTKVLFLSRLSMRGPRSWRLEPTYNREGDLTSNFTITNSPPGANMRELDHSGEATQFVHSWTDGDRGGSFPLELEYIPDQYSTSYVDRAVDVAMRFVSRHVDDETLAMLSNPAEPGVA